jgi:tryptophan synthase beta subunit
MESAEELNKLGTLLLEEISTNFPNWNKDIQMSKYWLLSVVGPTQLPSIMSSRAKPQVLP